MTPIGDEDLDGKRHDAPEWNVDRHLRLKDIVSAKQEIQSSQEFEFDSENEMRDIVEWDVSSSAEELETETDAAERERIERENREAIGGLLRAAAPPERDDEGVG